MNKDFLDIIDDNTARLTRILEMLNEIETTDRSSKEKLVRSKNLIATSIQSLEFAKTPATKNRFVIKMTSSDENSKNNDCNNKLGK